MSALRKYHIPGPGALLVLLAFFLPWVSVGCEGLLTVEGSGYNLASGNMFTELDSLLGGSNVPIDESFLPSQRRHLSGSLRGIDRLLTVLQRNIKVGCLGLIDAASGFKPVDRPIPPISALA